MTPTAGTLVRVQIRRARPQDADRLVPLYEQRGYPQMAADVRERLALWADTPEAEVLVAEVDGALAGFIGVGTTPHLALPGRVARGGGVVGGGPFPGGGGGGAGGGGGGGGGGRGGAGAP